MFSKVVGWFGIIAGTLLLMSGMIPTMIIGGLFVLCVAILFVIRIID